MVPSTETQAQGVDATGTVTPAQVAAMAKRTNETLLRLIRQNFNTQFAMQAPGLSEFREAVSAHGGTNVDDDLLTDFRSHVPLSNYTAYKPFADRFNMQPCKKEDVENLLAPGLPNFVALTSGTTAKVSKLVPRYDQDPEKIFLDCPFFNLDGEKPIAAARYCGMKDVRDIVDASGRVVDRIPIGISSGGRLRRWIGWRIEDERRWLASKAPYYTVPWAVTTINCASSFMTLHGLFFLARRDVDAFSFSFAPLFLDLIHHIDKWWYVLVASIRDGILPDLEGIDDVREYIQAHFHANAERAAELLEIGPPFAIEGWAARVWPEARFLSATCSGPFITVLPRIKSILGPNIPILCRRFGASEGVVGYPHDVNKPEEFVLVSDGVFEFLDISQDPTRANIRQAWEVEVGKYYEPILTNRNGLWRYRLGDVVCVIGFHVEKNSPIFKYLGRKLLTICLPHGKVTDYQLLEAIMAICSEDTIQVQEFTTVLDDRTSPPTVGFFVELAGPVGPNAHLAPQQLSDGLADADAGYRHALKRGEMRLPTVRIVKTGTFAAYRQRATQQRCCFGSMKVPSVMLDPIGRDWFSEGVVREL